MSARRWIVVPVALMTLSLVASTSDAQEGDVRAAITETLAAWSAGDLERLGQFYGTDARGFLFGGGPLVKGFNAVVLQAAYDAGFRATFEVRGLEVRVSGDAAMAVAYLDGTLTLPDGEEEVGSWRYSETRVRDGERWKIAQYHFSKVTTPAAR
jgi:uncharacterized protein (TIGR02246 family)